MADRWRGVSEMRAWLFSMMHNLYVDGVRRPKLSTVTMDEDTPEVPLAPTQGDRLAVEVARWSGSCGGR